MKISMRIFTILGGALLLFSCENNSVSKQIAIEQQRQDSLLLVSEKIVAEEKTRTTRANEEANKIKKEKADAEESDQIRIKKEHDEEIEYEKKLEQESKAYAEKAKEHDRQLRSESAKGPQWINGMWRYEGYVSTRMGSLYFNSALKIDRDRQTLVWVDGSDVMESGKYEVYGGAIHCNSSYWELDEVNHRIGLGNGEYFFKK